MTRVPAPGPSAAAGPFDTEAQTRAVTAPIYAAVRQLYGRAAVGAMAPHNHRMLCEALTAAGVELGAYDHRIVQWLAGWEPQTCAVIAGLITRARSAGSLTAPEVATVLDALDVAAEYKRDRAATCPDCDASPADLCGTCAWRLHQADEYDALAKRIRESQ